MQAGGGACCGSAELVRCSACMQAGSGALLEEQLQEGKGSLGAAYAALNHKYEAQKAGHFQGLAADSQELSDLAQHYSAHPPSTDSEKQRLLSSGSRSARSSGSERRARGITATNGMGGKFLGAGDLEHLNMLAATQKVAVYHVQQSPLLTVTQAQEAQRKETKARKKVRVVVWPMFLYFLFILAAGYYFYTRLVHGMGGLTAPLRSYSYFVLFVEMLGAINMLFYACWLFARPINSDVFPPLLDNGAPPRPPPLLLPQTALLACHPMPPRLLLAASPCCPRAFCVLSARQ